jgi:hypothetical protein
LTPSPPGSTRPAEPVRIPYERTTLPGYALTVNTSGKPGPWLIMTNGSDGTVADMWAQGAAAALRRGYNVLIFDGPGQGAALYRQHLFFRFDWEKVITPVVDWLLTRPDVDPSRIGIIGISQGGYWVPRAVAFEYRIAAAIADPGVVDSATGFAKLVSPEDLRVLLSATGRELERIKTRIDRMIAKKAAGDPRLAYTLAFRTRPYGTKSPAEVILLTSHYKLRGVIDRIRCPMLIADPEGEQFWPGQSQHLYNGLTGPKTLVPFTAAEGADLHVDPLARRFCQDRRDPRRERCLICFGDAAVQHDELDGASDPQCVVVLCAVRARGHRRANPRQDRRLKTERNMDGRGAAARLSGAGAQAGHHRQRGGTRALDLSPLRRTRLGAVVTG